MNNFQQIMKLDKTSKLVILYILLSSLYVQIFTKLISSEVDNYFLSVNDYGGNITLSNGLKNFQFSLVNLEEVQQNFYPLNINNNGTNTTNKHGKNNMRESTYQLSEFVKDYCDKTPCKNAKISKTLPNGANIEIQVGIFENDEGANNPIKISKGAAKVMISVKNWPFCKDASDQDCLDSAGKLIENPHILADIFTSETFNKKTQVSNQGEYSLLFFGDAEVRVYPQSVKINPNITDYYQFTTSPIKDGKDERLMQIVFRNGREFDVKFYIDLNLPENYVNPQKSLLNFTMDRVYAEVNRYGGEYKINNILNDEIKTSVKVSPVALYEIKSDKTYLVSKKINMINLPSHYSDLDVIMPVINNNTNIYNLKIANLQNLNKSHCNLTFSEDASVYRSGGYLENFETYSYKNNNTKEKRLPIDAGDYSLSFSVKDYPYCDTQINSTCDKTNNNTSTYLDFELNLYAQSDKKNAPIYLFIGFENLGDSTNINYIDKVAFNNNPENSCVTDSLCNIKIRTKRFGNFGRIKIVVKYKNPFPEILIDKITLGNINIYQRGGKAEIAYENSFSTSMKFQLRSIIDSMKNGTQLTPFQRFDDLSGLYYDLIQVSRGIYMNLNVTKYELKAANIYNDAKILINYTFFNQTGSFKIFNKNQNITDEYSVNEKDFLVSIRVENFESCVKDTRGNLLRECLGLESDYKRIAFNLDQVFLKSTEKFEIDIDYLYGNSLKQMFNVTFNAAINEYDNIYLDFPASEKVYYAEFFVNLEKKSGSKFVIILVILFVLLSLIVLAFVVIRIKNRNKNNLIETGNSRILDNSI